MKPRFALNLSHDGIGLLHRSAGGWTPVGEVALSAPDMGDKLKMLRATATALESGGVTSKLVIPDSQILYTTLDVTAKDTAVVGEIRKSLDGLTPYAIDDLVFDYDVKDGRAQVAVVARETLQEAEEFAAKYRFNPVSFVAIPGDGQFPREPSFGLTKAAATLIPEGDTVEADTAPIIIVERGAPEDSLDTPDKAPEAAPEPSPAPIPQSDAAPAPDAVPERPTEPPTAPHIAPLLPPQTRPSFSTSRQGPVAANPEPPQHAARITLLLPPEGEAPKLAGAERNVGVTTPLPPELAEPPAPTPEKPKKAKRKEKLEKPEPKPDPVVKTTVPIATAIAPPPEDEAEALTVFGARRKQEQPGKPRYLGLILTVVLLLAMAAIALWSALFSTREVALLPDAVENKVPSITAPPVEKIAPAQEIAPAPAETIAPPTAIIEAPVEPEQAEPAPEELASQPVEPEIEAAPPPPMSEEDARVAYAATGIWQLAPAAPPVARHDTQDDIYIASIAPGITGEDAVALPPAETEPTDPPLDAPGLPPAPGQFFTLDARGLVIPSVDGTLSPEGHRVFSGKPPVVPPARPQSAEGLTPQEETDAQTERTRLLALRPRARPDNLAERQERAETGGGFSRAELAAKKPRARPPSAQDSAALTESEAEADGEESNETDQSLALASSRVPQNRPPNFESAVQKALKEAQAAAPAVPAAAAITPKIPTTASVAKQATITNAINLSKVNLIGVYGSSSDRRALVRLPTGRYIKVQVGDRIDGGKVAAIDESELRYVKNGRNIVLKMPASS